MLLKRETVLLAFLCWIGLLLAGKARAQPVNCPNNIGFELGNFNNWECLSGIIDGVGTISLNPTGPLFGAHTMIPSTSTELDPYGNFPVVCPNGSNYSIRLGNDGTGGEAERVSYTFTIPANVTKYTIIFNYAVVLENPNHQSFEQPKFRAEVFDVTTNAYINCASFEFVAGPNLPGFEPSPVRSGVFFKNWSPVTINLGGYAGKTIRLEFTTNDCSKGGHFGYAYVDVDENCTSPVKGATYCGNPASINLIAPSGFFAYQWYDPGFTQLLGTTNSLTLTPPPPSGTTFKLILTPFPNQGCLDTLNVVVNASSDALNLVLKDTLKACLNPGADLTAAAVSAGSTPGLQLTYYTDALGTVYVQQPKYVKTSGTYYVAATNSAGCRIVKPLFVKVLAPPVFTLVDTATGCAGQLNLTNPALVTFADPGTSFTYWRDSAGTLPVTNPTAVSEAGTYYVRGVNEIGCPLVRRIFVKMPDLLTHSMIGCSAVNLTAPAVTAFSSPGYSFSYWTNAGATTPLPNPQAVASSGTYYIRGEHASGCVDVKPVLVTVNPAPQFTTVNPPPVDYPATINLLSTIVASGTYAYTFWRDSLATQQVVTPGAIGASGTYYVKTLNSLGCATVRPVTVIVTPPPPVSVDAPNAFSPNGDGINDFFFMKVKGYVRLEGIRIFNRWGQEVYETRNLNFYWDGKREGKLLPVGVYYWLLEGTDTYRKTKVVLQGSLTLVN